MSTRFLLTATFGWAFASSLLAADKLWVNDFEKAKQSAATEGKDLLMDFTGSDWCGWCIKLNKEVFDLEAFKTAAPKSFVLVELDYPQDKSKLSKEVQEQNAKLQTHFAIRGFPTILLADAAGRPYAQTGYQQGGAEAYVKHLDELRAVKTKRDEAWKKAEGAQGGEKAKFLAEGLKALDFDLAAAHYKPVVEEIAKLDPQDENGVTASFTFKSDLEAVKGKLIEAARKGEAGGARKQIDDFIAAHPKATGLQKQEALMAVLSTYRPPKDNEAVLKLMMDVKAIDEKSPAGQRAEMIIKQVRKMMEEAKPAPEPAKK
jgi:thioredoxin-related protein